MGDAALRERMAKAGRERVIETFSWASIARQTYALYEEMLATGD
jgi:starch synthase